MRKPLLLSAIVLVFAGLASGESMQDILAHDDDSAHGNRFLLCKDMPGTRFLTIRPFHLANADAWSKGNGKVRAELKEMDPIRIREAFRKENCSAGVNDLSIYYDWHRDWVWESGDPTALVMTANIPFQRLGQAVCNYEGMSSCLPDLVKARESYLDKIMVKDLLTVGKSLELYQKFLRDNPIRVKLTELEQDYFAILPNLNIPRKVRLNSDPLSFGRIMLLDGQKELGWWKGKGQSASCWQLNGVTFGDVFYQKINRLSELQFYSEELCSPVPLQFSKVVNPYGFDMLQFTFAPKLLTTAKCFCPQEGATNCMKDGAVNVGPCHKNLPYVMSFPHFLEAEKSYLENLAGLKANPDKHASYFWIEPVTGTVVESAQKLQLNVNLRRFKFEDPGLGKGFPNETILPVYWFEKHYRIDNTHIEALRNYLQNPTTASPFTPLPTTPIVPKTTTVPPEPIDPQLETLNSMIVEVSKQITFLATGFFIFMLAAFVVQMAIAYFQMLRQKELAKDLNKNREMPVDVRVPPEFLQHNSDYFVDQK